jgi:hypothetical protein
MLNIYFFTFLFDIMKKSFLILLIFQLILAFLTILFHIQIKYHLIVLFFQILKISLSFLLELIVFTTQQLSFFIIEFL